MELRPETKSVLIIGWSGMRGIVSLASALAIPYLLANGSNFPHRNLILFIKYNNKLCTLVLQELSLPILVRRLKVEKQKKEKEQQKKIRLRLATVVLDHIT